ncbi:class I SAM-dependent DNA methyltransferase [Curtobacterium sp. MCJR17_020]|uniref:Eco57I restriction-modification methylase domain-containing protein n=1 Tax=Curtobacterium sp. MCJR17_020 TaxID=2175619 RepID=UPI0021ACDFD9|nr:class I SAM-dependent DNA methyltransferase [Curtobacterium sp. MCJR17_020]WIE73526.1 class I SAM-dependent DNA methyltransferase [Curtobacterium sp. MCJR17_020]
MANLTSEAIIVGEDWISEHYLTTDAPSQSFQARVRARRSEWDETDADHDESTRARFSAHRSELLSSLTTISPDTDDDGSVSEAGLEAVRTFLTRLRSVLGYADGAYDIRHAGPLRFVALHGVSGGAPLVLLDAKPFSQLESLMEKNAETLLEPWSLDDEATGETSVVRALSTVFASEAPPTFALVMAGRWMLVAERERWFEGRYLAIDLQLVCERNDTKRGGEIDRMLTSVEAASLAPDPDGEIWWSATLDDAVKHTVGVSEDLREGVRESIEIIANDVVTRRAAVGLPQLPPSEAQPLAKQSLRYLYRILFLLYAEASPQLEILPVGSPQYENGYSLDRLRELTLVELASPVAQTGTHFYESLAVLFRMVHHGHRPERHTRDGLQEGLPFESIRADLFEPAAVAHIDAVQLSDDAMQQVLARLLLSRESRSRDRGFISYADLGINQLGAVYEGLMSYTGFFAEEDLFEVAPDSNPAKGSWVLPVTQDSDIEERHFLMRTDAITGEPKRVRHEKGSFVYRLAGRERQQSASYYTPEALTQFTVSQALEELLDQDGSTTSAEEILTLTVCEPALGSGAFAIEAVRQLADQYLTRKQSELDQRIDPDEYPAELQRVKASIALHQVYGVDLNATAVEFAEITLWLDTMSEGLQAPWFGLHLRRGNSLIGARRAVYDRAAIASKAWLKTVPRDAPLFTGVSETDAPRAGVDGTVHHFLLPAEGWGSAVDAKEAKELATEALAALKGWRRQVLAKPTKQQTDTLVALGYRVERLWDIARRRLEIAEHEIRRDIPLWGSDSKPDAGGAISREEIEHKLSDPNGAYQRLHRAMDAWCAMWFWPLTDTLTEGATPPTLDEWIATLRQLLGEHTTARPAAARHGQVTLGARQTGWEALNDEEADDLAFASVTDLDVLLVERPWLGAAERITQQQGFFHWELDFAPVFARGGFDLQVGNPPWVRPDWDEAASLGEHDPWWTLTAKPPAAEVIRRRQLALTHPLVRRAYLDDLSSVVATRSSVGDTINYPLLAGLRPDLYRCFMEQTWRHASQRGATGLIHPETHFTDEKARELRRSTYARLRQHWHFINEKMLFEIDDKASFGVHIYGSILADTQFEMATYLYHPDVARRSRVIRSSAEEPGLKDPDGNWDIRPHQGRILRVDDSVLRTWHAILEDSDVPVRQTRMVYAVNKATAVVLEKIAGAPRLDSLGLEFSQGWNETTDFKRGMFDKRWGQVGSWDDAILQGPHIFVGNPFYKSPNSTMLHNQDWSSIDLETLAPDALPVTAYKPAAEQSLYDAAYTHWGADHRPARNSYRVAWRNMAANKNERTLISSIIPPGPAHVNAVMSASASSESIGLIAAVMSSLVSDFLVRAVGPSTVNRSVVRRLPIPESASLIADAMAWRGLTLNCVTSAWAPLWQNSYSQQPSNDLSNWAGGHEYAERRTLGDREHDWSDTTPLRRASDRRQAHIEIDALFALSLGLTADELCTIYRTQFAVLYGYDHNVYFYDSNGRLVPNEVLKVWRQKQEGMSAEERTATNASGNTYTYELPFRTLDREADMRQAYAHFEKLLEEQS